MSTMRVWPPLLLTVLVAGCGTTSDQGGVADVEDASPGGVDTVGVVDAVDSGPELAPLPQGVSSCALAFVDGDRCEPSLGHCEAGESVSVSAGCVPVGPGSCADEFVDEEGVCRAAAESCPEGSLPVLAEGCQPVGVLACWSDFVDDHAACVPDANTCGPHAVTDPLRGCLPVGPAELWPGFRDVLVSCESGFDSACEAPAQPFLRHGCLTPADLAPCGEGRWGLVEPRDGDVHVDANDGDDQAPGTRRAPLKTLAAALDAAQVGARVVLAAGEWDEAVVVTRDVHIVGRCPAQVRIQGALPDAEGTPVVASIQGPFEATVAGVTLSGAGVGVAVSGGAQVQVRDVVVESCAIAGLGVAEAGSLLVAERVAVSGMQGPEAYGVVALEGGKLEALDLVVHGTPGIGALAHGPGSTIDLRSSLLHATESTYMGDSGQGADATEGGRVTLIDSVVSGSRVWGAVSFGAGSRLDVVRSWLGCTRAEYTSGEWGHGLLVSEGATATAVDTVVADNLELGVLVSGGGSLVAERLLVRGTRNHAGVAEFGMGLVVSGGDADLTSVALVDNEHSGMRVVGEGSTTASSLYVAATRSVAANGVGGEGLAVIGATGVELSDLVLVANRDAALAAVAGAAVTVSRAVIADTLPATAGGDGGRGLEVNTGSSLTATDLLLTRNTNVGAAIQDAGSHATLSRAVVRGTTTVDPYGLLGWGVVVEDGATADLTDVMVHDNGTVGLLVQDEASSVTAHRLVASDTRAESSGTWGHGARAQLGGQLELFDSVVSGSHEAGISAYGPTASVTLERCVVADTKPRPGTDDFGFGLVSTDGASMLVRDSVVVDSHWVAVAAGGADTAVSVERSLLRRSAPYQDAWTGWGTLAIDGAAISCAACTLVEHSDRAVVVTGPGSTTSVVDSLVAQTRTVGGTVNGGALEAEDGAQLDVLESVVTDHHFGGVVVRGATATLASSYIARVVGASYLQEDHSVVETGDGVIATQGAQVDVTHTRIDGCARAALLYLASSGDVADVFGRGNGLGLVADGTPEPSSEEVAFQDLQLVLDQDGEEPVVVDDTESDLAGVPVPDGPLE